MPSKSLPEKRPDARHASPSKRSLLDVNEHCEGEHNNADGTLRTGSKGGLVNTRTYGSRYEDMACEHLSSLGYQILDRNWHYSNRGELDIVALDPNRYGEEYLIFVEVKARAAGMLESLHALSFNKIKQLKKLALAYLNYKKLKNINISFDFIAISQEKLEHIKDIV